MKLAGKKACSCWPLAIGPIEGTPPRVFLSEDRSGGGGQAGRSALSVSEIMTDYNAERGLVQVVGVHGQDETGRV